MNGEPGVHICPRCGQPAKDLPGAYRLGIYFLCRQLYAVRGHAGLWWRRKIGSEESIRVKMKHNPPTVTTLYRAVDAEERVGEAMMINTGNE